ncbi:Peptidase M16 domain protein, related [Neospora caninum Liverpool]|uniref:Peptidase M16 domain protein, related n=1 Tax=Neospora caninum (strain Liverpool) TaxID=572307 RepID=F0VEH1_NEOCL|nr:Peptidase M16 domain protein, related [Neospora caninum Liverpool]CBZ52115.1 Peptidase M16 domain protein, related [Neospora caninum Liverpool]CEL66077.1 TPA: Peptidase M16 domain protein, related [Neospora caninum Liverpool]|eukprot:XP_003882147.1 Peptidase M16 domain protein, related [Neospora caninum Liverpool]
MALRVTEEIDKPQTDRRSYRFVQLPNHLSVLLVSDAEADLASAALDVNVGAFFDPRPVEGLAHFCEHMLFLGTEKFPDETEYSNFIKQHGGCNNAYTEHTHTNYHFSVAPEHLEGALDRFSQFFVSPLFTESATDRELNAVDSEFRLRLVNDFIRRWHLLHKLANPEHPFNRFSCGNLVSLQEVPKALGADVRQELLAFHKKWYSANIMTLVILGKDSLDRLQDLAEKYFGTIQNKQVPLRPSRAIVDPNVPVFRPEEDLQQVAYIVPIKDQREIHFEFVLPPQIDAWKTKPTRYLSHLVGHEGKGSLLSALKKEGLAIGLNSWSLDEECVSIFYISIELTEQGASDAGIDRVEDLVFLYLSLLRTSPVQEWVFEESRSLAEMGFRFADTENPLPFCISHAKYLHRYPPEYALSGPHLFFSLDKTQIEDILQRLTLDALRIEVVGKRYADLCTSKEDIYDISYHTEAFSSKQRQRWGGILRASPQEAWDAATKEGLSFPTPNPFVPTDLSLRPLAASPSSASSLPCALPVSGLGGDGNQSSFPHLAKVQPQIYFKQDDTFLLPKLSVRLWIKTPVPATNNQDVLTEFYMRTWVYVQTVAEMVNEDLYDAEVAGLYFTLNGGDWPGEISLSAQGFNDKLPLLVDKLTFALSHSGAVPPAEAHREGSPDSAKDAGKTNGEAPFRLDRRAFDVVKENLHRKLSNSILYRTVSQQAATLRGEALEIPYFSYEELLRVLEKLAPADVEEVPRTLFQRACVEALIVGNMSSAEAYSMVEMALKNLNIETKLDGSSLPEKAVVDLASLNLARLRSSLPGHCAAAASSPSADASTDRQENGHSGNGDTKLCAVRATEDLKASEVKLKIRSENSNPQDPNSAAFLRFQVGDLEIRERSMLSLFSHCVSQAFFDELRTQQQLGYVVHAHRSFQLRSQGMDFFVAGSKFSADLMATRIERFVEKYIGSLRHIDAVLSDSLFEKHRAALISELKVRPQNVFEEAQRYAQEISTRHFLFDRRERTVAELASLEKNEFLRFILHRLRPSPVLLLCIDRQAAASDLASREGQAAGENGESLQTETQREAQKRRASESQPEKSNLFEGWTDVPAPRELRNYATRTFAMPK